MIPAGRALRIVGDVHGDSGAFAIAAETDAFAAAIGALVTFGIAGELAALPNPGPGSFQVGLLDALDAIDGAVIRARARVAFS